MSKTSENIVFHISEHEKEVAIWLDNQNVIKETVICVVNAVKGAVIGISKCSSQYLPHKRLTTKERLSITKDIEDRLYEGEGERKNPVSAHEQIQQSF